MEYANLERRIPKRSILKTRIGLELTLRKRELLKEIAGVFLRDLDARLCETHNMIERQIREENLT
jgi:hypothetical protein